jgi:hypothetical protein
MAFLNSSAEVGILGNKRLSIIYAFFDYLVLLSSTGSYQKLN